ncbi:MAG: hypothetical protein Q8M20_12055 [Rhodocyclaceae bacterium]|nr:hypothetical protein [Rhodocyclaceae bacterium]MDZ4215719.1 hypothetical protein [Rhodocyclaceae bacterium]
MSAMFQFKTRLHLLILTVVSVAVLSGCSTTETQKLTLGYTDANGTLVEKPYSLTRSATTTMYSGTIRSNTSEDIQSGVPLGLEGLQPGTKIVISGAATPNNADAMGVMTTNAYWQCAQGPCQSESVASMSHRSEKSTLGLLAPFKDTPEAKAAKTALDNCIATHMASCLKTEQDRSYSITCPDTCDAPKKLDLVPNEALTLSCQCAMPTPPKCTDVASLAKTDANGNPLWTVCTPVQLPTMNPNDPLLKEMMAPGGGGCRRVYSMALHQFVCL